jgi:endonuclease-3
MNFERILYLLKKTYPDVETALDFENPYQLWLLRCFLSNTDIQVNKVTKNLFPKYPSPKELAEATQDELENDIKTIGLYKKKVRI